MDLSDFRIGAEFMCSDRRWRCTDLGTRVLVAIRVDELEITSKRDGEPTTRHVLSGAEAAAAGWFSGPPYGVAEIVFDEDDLEACEPV